MFDSLRAVLAHFGAPAGADASQAAHVPEEAWATLLALFSTPANEAEAAVKTAVTNAEQSVHTSLGNVVVQLQAGDLHKLTQLAAEAPTVAADPPKESAPAKNPTGGKSPPAPLV